MGQQFADPSYQFFGCFNAFFSPTWKKQEWNKSPERFFTFGAFWATLGDWNLHNIFSAQMAKEVSVYKQKLP